MSVLCHICRASARSRAEAYDLDWRPMLSDSADAVDHGPVICLQCQAAVLGITLELLGRSPRPVRVLRQMNATARAERQMSRIIAASDATRAIRAQRQAEGGR